MEQENNNLKILGIMFLCEFALSALMYLFLFLMVGLSTIMAFVGAKNTDASAFAATSGIVIIVCVIAFILIAPLGVAGWKLLKNKPNARGWGIAASFMSIFFMCPLGLIVSIFGFVFLFGKLGQPAHQNMNYGNIHQNDQHRKM